MTDQNKEDTAAISAETAALNERHRVRMERKKAIIDAQIAAADKQIGIIIVNTGNGKGKSSSGFGMVIRALGHGMKVGVVQFIKGAMQTGEEAFLRRFPEEVSFHTMGEGYTWETQNRERDTEKALLAWEQAKKFLADPAIGLVVFDELNIALKYRYLDVEMVINDLLARPPMPALKACLTTSISVTVSAMAISSGGAPRPVMTTCCIGAQLGTEW